MNYLQQIRGFNDFLTYNQKLSSGQISLWYALMWINNKTGWAKWFTAANLTLESMSGLSRSGVNKARNALKQYGLIDFKSHGSKATAYSVCQLYTSDSTQDSVQDSAQVRVVKESQKSRNGSTLNKLNKTKKEKDKKNAPQYGADSPYLKLAKYLFEQIKTNDEKRKSLTDSQEQKWANTIRLMAERDEHKPNQIRNMIDWSQQDEFWHKVILSPTKLRKHYDQMKMQALENDKESKPKYSNERSTETVSAERERARKLNELVNSHEVSLNE
ncbi:hypothetical protein [Lentilactobacillus sp. SPB1-3]|uniref:Uncharacterized protein n=1 Tax=Lentilactobacillus terminaliae TaxID=3003483 RepID=A0ACD5DDA5_9LACO|nr:hypothetical protein [Lentilactobacillus sp. SPB1-3]MCZ0978059.1 hypothetical protein [Lentilactobacillus sp. SPB1-3]